MPGKRKHKNCVSGGKATTGKPSQKTELAQKQTPSQGGARLACPVRASRARALAPAPKLLFPFLAASMETPPPPPPFCCPGWAGLFIQLGAAVTESRFADEGLTLLAAGAALAVTMGALCEATRGLGRNGGEGRPSPFGRPFAPRNLPPKR